MNPLLLTAGPTGCIGGEADDETLDPTRNGAGPETQTPLEPGTWSFDGQAPAGLGLMATGTYAWFLSSQPVYDLEVRDDRGGGTLTVA